jgi:hypothetical protein
VRELFSLAVAGGCAVALGGSRVPRATWVVGREARGCQSVGSQ